MNRVDLIGRLTADPADQRNGSGRLFTRCRLAVRSLRSDGTDTFLNVLAFGIDKDRDGVAGVLKQYTRKGSQVHVGGHLQVYRREGVPYDELQIVVDNVELLSPKPQAQT